MEVRGDVGRDMRVWGVFGNVGKCVGVCKEV